ncbi:MAG: error-prone DNA polymerase, partial [Planctomycetia bacterium]|nr:error-prone DNA polymerase [Planctomycetia bacterium]
AHPLTPHSATLPLCHSATSPHLSLHTIPPEDPATYDMICNADTVGVFQIESRAQMSMLPRLRPRCYYDLVIEVAIVRPGPIQGKMVHPYLRRRTGQEPVRYASPEIERVLGRTLGVPLFQEQAMARAIGAAGVTPGEADQLRRAMAAWKRSGRAILAFERKLIDGMLQRGYSREFAAQVFQQVSGFSGYGFPESHAASFALLVYASSWLKRHHPAAFAAALINSQPMGFYQPAQIVRDAQAHSVEVRPVDVNASRWDCTLEPATPGPALRLGMRLVSGMPEAEAHRIAEAVAAHGPFISIDSLWRASGVRAATLRRLAAADAFASMNLTRQRAVWSVQSLKDGDAPLFDTIARSERSAARSALPAVSPESEVSSDYNTVGLSLRSHPIAFVRESLSARGITPNADLADESRCPAGRRITVAGLVLLRQRPSTASGIVFMTIEDETGTANLIIRPKVYERYRRVARHCRTVTCTGTVERAGQVVHVLVKSMQRLEPAGRSFTVKSRDFH